MNLFDETAFAPIIMSMGEARFYKFGPLSSKSEKSQKYMCKAWKSEYSPEVSKTIPQN